MRYLPLLREVERLDAWLYQIARNTLYDAIRARLNCASSPLTAAKPLEDTIPDAVKEFAALVERVAGRKPKPVVQPISTVTAVSRAISNARLNATLDQGGLGNPES